VEVRHRKFAFLRVFDLAEKVGPSHLDLVGYPLEPVRRPMPDRHRVEPAIEAPAGKAGIRSDLEKNGPSPRLRMARGDQILEPVDQLRHVASLSGVTPSAFRYAPRR
jgi:hypothetical protein